MTFFGGLICGMVLMLGIWIGISWLSQCGEEE